MDSKCKIKWWEVDLFLIFKNNKEIHTKFQRKTLLLWDFYLFIYAYFLLSKFFLLIRGCYELRLNQEVIIF